MNMTTDTLPLLATRKIPRSSEINITSITGFIDHNQYNRLEELGLGHVLRKILICFNMIQRTPFFLLHSKAELRPRNGKALQSGIF